MRVLYFTRRGLLVRYCTRNQIRFEFHPEGQVVTAVKLFGKRIITNAPVGKVERKPPYEL